MDFYINQNSTLPILKMELIKDGRNDYGTFHDKLQTANITFCMTDIATGVKRIGNKAGLCILKEPTPSSLSEEYYIGYRFTKKETKKTGSYSGTFTITFPVDENGNEVILIVPIKDELFIHVLNP